VHAVDSKVAPCICFPFRSVKFFSVGRFLCGKSYQAKLESEMKSVKLIRNVGLHSKVPRQPLSESSGARHVI
jgi:hypothetical protein